MNYDNQHIFVIGGLKPGDFRVNFHCCEFYDIKTDVWTKPEASLHTQRMSNSTCVVGHFLYTFGGSRRGKRLKSIEKLDAEKTISGVDTQWELLRIPFLAV